MILITNIIAKFSNFIGNIDINYILMLNIFIYLILNIFYIFNIQQSYFQIKINFVFVHKNIKIKVC